MTLAAIFAGEREEVERLCGEHELSLALTQEKNEAFELYKLRGTPRRCWSTFNGIIAGAPAEGVPAIEALIRTAAASSVRWSYRRSAHDRGCQHGPVCDRRDPWLT